MSRCVTCGEVITHPLCPTCIQQEAAVWVCDIAPDLRSEIPSDPVLASDESACCCIKCSNSFKDCTYCSTKELISWAKTHPEFLHRFKETFHIEVEHSGYMPVVTTPRR